MNLTRVRWIRFLFAGLCITAAPLGVSIAQAQGFGPDPFRPFNSQYMQYAYPIAPETGGAAMPGRGMNRGDNQYQQWLTEQEGASRLGSRNAAGVPYWKLRTDLAEDLRERRSRRNVRNDDAIGSITQKYLAYFSEPNPARRAILLRDYTPIQRDDERDGERGEGRLGPDATRRPAAGRRAGAATSPRGPGGVGEEKSGRRIPPAPAPSIRGSGRSPRRPTEVLDRVRALDDNNADTARTPARTRSNRRATDPPPSQDE
jgi:hypothetical protein